MRNMQCLKCGRNTEGTFCPLCLEDMAKHPVKPDAIVLLPKERIAPKKVAPRHPVIPPEVTVENQRRLIRRLARCVAVLGTLLALMGFILFRVIEEESKPQVGKNYSTVTKPAEESADNSTIIIED